MKFLIAKFVAMMATLALAFSAAALPPSAPTKLSTMTLKAGGQTVTAEIAANDATRQQGLMFRTKMGTNDGMLFVFPQLGYHAMWMKNTFIPLSVAYLDDAGKILSIHEMEAHNETAHQSQGPARYALEMNTGWFTRHKIAVGDTVKGLDKAPKPQ